jgi:hypothetical protein
MRREITIQKRRGDAILPPDNEGVGELPLEDEIFSLMRSGQNRAHSLALELKRQGRVYDRVKAQSERIKALEKLVASLRQQLSTAETERDTAKGLARDRELELIKLRS